MTILSAIGVSLISVAVAGYLVSLLRTAHRPAHQPDLFTAPAPPAPDLIAIERIEKSIDDLSAALEQLRRILKRAA